MREAQTAIPVANTLSGRRRLRRFDITVSLRRQQGKRALARPPKTRVIRAKSGVYQYLAGSARAIVLRPVNKRSD